jgi:hypothetical protein
MNPELQSEILKSLAQVRALAPDVRIAQLFAHLGFLGETHLNRGLGYLEDDELLALLYRHRTELLNRLPSQTATTTVDVNLSLSGSPSTADVVASDSSR